MLDIIYRYDPNREEEPSRPADVAQAQLRLEEGNRRFSHLLHMDPDAEVPGPPIIHFRLEDMGIVKDGSSLVQAPYAVVLGCADARVPVEMIFSEGCNNLFVIRVAGNVLGSECLGSIDYAIDNFSESLKLIVVLGHSGCGAVTAAVKAFLKPSRYLAIASSHPLRAIVDRLLLSVHAAEGSLVRVHGSRVTKRVGYERALVEMAVIFNSALTAAAIKQELVLPSAPGIRVCFTIYDLAARCVRVPTKGFPEEGKAAVRMLEPPMQADDMNRLAEEVAASGFITGLLKKK